MFPALVRAGGASRHATPAPLYATVNTVSPFWSAQAIPGPPWEASPALPRKPRNETGILMPSWHVDDSALDIRVTFWGGWTSEQRNGVLLVQSSVPSL